MRITGRLVALVAIGVVVAALPVAVLIAYAVALLVLVAVDLRQAARIADLRVTRSATSAMRLGTDGQTVLTVVNAGRRRARVVVRDAWVPSAGVTPRSHRVAVPAERRVHVRSTLRPTRRGTRRAVHVTVASFGPLGLAARQRRVSVPGSVRVVPPFTSRRFLPEKLTRLRQIEGALPMRRRGQGSEFDSLQPYVQGDDTRSIDWRATARSSDVVVRTWRPERDRQILLALDTGRTSAARIGDEPRLDAAVDACLLLATVAGRAGDRVGLVAGDIRVRARVGVSAGPGLPGRLIAALTPLEPALVETDPAVLGTQVLQSLPRRSLVVLFTGLDAGSATAGLLPMARMIGAHHRLVVAAVADPSLDALAARRDTAADVYTAAAAELASAQRRDLAEELGRRGVTVVDAPPDVFASRVTDAYLSLKAAGLL